MLTYERGRATSQRGLVEAMVMGSEPRDAVNGQELCPMDLRDLQTESGLENANFIPPSILLGRA